MWIQALKESKLEDINRDNLLRGKDSEGQDMPLYAPTEYGLDKSNPLNRGHWDLKLTGQYHLGITAKITAKEVSFYQKYNNKKIRWLDMVLDKANRNPLGITKEQFNDVQSKNSEKVNKQINDIINNG